ncbi:MAG: undecaprenyl-diphosphate phosphatase [Gemmatimonadetes bacterium]|nr:undecaprenyl-diphosphate phosphatase [Gemmatimonadota bacterium]
MTWWEGAILGFLQGATEFLPVSSSGHLVMGQALLGLRLPGLGFEVALHLATLLSVLVVYRERIASLLGGVVRGDSDALRYSGLLIVASVPAAGVGLGFEERFDALFDIPWVTGVALLVTGVILWTSRAALRREPSREPGLGDAVLMGVAQAAAIIPGISRSGSTVVTGLWRGVAPQEAAAFSFLMSIPAVGGAAVLKLPEMLAGDAGASSGVLLLGAAVACVTGVLAIRTFVAMLRHRSFHHFAPYLWVVGVLFLLASR